MSYTIMMIEDDHEVAKGMMFFLKNSGYKVVYHKDGSSALDYVSSNKVDLILLDVNLPDVSGLEVCAKVRQSSNVPIIVVSAVDETGVKLKLLNAGCDDYMVKPIDLKELNARMVANLRRTNNEINSYVSDKINLELIKSGEYFKLNGKVLDLTVKEYVLLEYLFLNRDRVVPKEVLKDVLNLPQTSRALDVHIKNIRKKLNNESIIKVIYGQGIVLEI